MIEQKVDIFSDNLNADAICVTTNGVVKKDGRLVMGAGAAKQFRDKVKGLDKSLGGKVSVWGNYVHVSEFAYKGAQVLSFPTKYHWRDKSDINLIKDSAERLTQLTYIFDWSRVFLTRPGCRLGGLKWNDVKPVLREYFDDRFIIAYL